jgi:hypothetical protein
MITVTKNAGQKEVTKVVVVVPARPETFSIEVDKRAVLWLLVIAGCHNGTSKTNPLCGLYQNLSAALGVSLETEIEIQNSRDSLRRCLDRYNINNYIDVHEEFSTKPNL